MSAQGKPGYFVDAKTGIPIGHVDEPGCTCVACVPYVEPTRSEIRASLEKQFGPMSDEDAEEAVGHLVFHEGPTQTYTTTATIGDVEVSLDGLSDAVDKVRVIRERYEAARAKAVAEHGHIPVALAEAELARRAKCKAP